MPFETPRRHIFLLNTLDQPKVSVEIIICIPATSTASSEMYQECGNNPYYRLGDDRVLVTKDWGMYEHHLVTTDA
jgi:hypothetical protein